MSVARVAPLSYQDRLRHLIERKGEQTREKVDRFGHMDEDDLGLVAPPEDFEWRKEILGTIERPAAREGKLLYAR